MIINIYDFKLFLAEIVVEKDCLISVKIKESEFKSLKYIEKINENSTEEENKYMKKVIKEISEYLKGNLMNFTINYKIQASKYEKKVYNEVSKTKYGRTYSYKEIAILTGNEKASRAVANALKKNKLAIIIPCHRVLNSKGEISNYFDQKSLQKKLIEIEKENYEKLCVF